MKAQGLKKQIIALVPKAGMQQKIDDKALPIENFELLENCYIQKLGRIAKMPGQSTLSRDIAGGESLTSADGVAVFRNELLLFSENSLFAYDTSGQKWVDKGAVSVAATSSQQVVRNTRQQTVPDATLNQGTVVYAWEDTDGVRARATDYATDTIIASDTLLRASSIRPKTVSQGSVSLIFYALGSTIYVRRYDRNGDPTEFGTEVSLFADLNASSQLFDVCPFSDAVAIVYHTNGGEVKFAYVTTTPALGTPAAGYPNPTTLAVDADQSLTCWPMENQLLMVAYSGTTPGTQVTARKAVDLTQEFAPVTMLASGTDVRNVCGVLVDGTISHVYYEVSDPTPQFNYVLFRTVDIDGTLTSQTTVRRSVGLASKPMVQEEHSFVHCVFDTTLQATYFLIRDDGQIFSRVASGNAGGLTARSVLPEVSEPVDNSFFVPSTIKSAFVSEGATTFSTTGVSRIDYDLRGTSAPSTFSTDVNMVLLGGLMQIYDGLSFFEQGYHAYPEGMTGVVAGGGSIAAGTYQYAFMWEWYDARGQIHRSAPSVPEQVAVGANQKVTWTVPTLRLTARDAPRTPPVLAAYRTERLEDGGSLFYRVSSRVTVNTVNGLVYNDTAADTITFEDQLVDADIISNELLYTTGDVLENLPAQPCTTGTLFKGRLFIDSTDGSGAVFYAKFSATGEAIAFHPVLTVQTDPDGGDVDSFGVLDDKLLLQKDFAQWVTFGEPASNTGINGTLAVPERVAVSTGCAQPVTVLRTEFGVVYKASKGYYLMDRGLSEDYFGAGVEDYNDLTAVAAVEVPTLNQIRFYHSDGPCLIFDTYFKTWSIFNNRTAIDAVVWRGMPAMVDANGQVWVEDGLSDFTNAGSYVPMRIRTGWISLANVQAFMRVWRLLLLMEYKSAHQVYVRIATDFESAWKQAVYVDPAVGLNTAPYGTGDYGEESPYGLSSDTPNLDSVYQARIHVVPQKCQSIKLYIEDMQSGTVGTGEGFQLNIISLAVGLKRGEFKPNAAKNFG